jgi:DNA polymerase family B, exonuclease domain
VRRPSLSARTVETNVSTVFQQVDIDGSYDNLQAGPQINIFGVTQVRLVRLVPFSPLICFCVKEGHSVLIHVTGFMPYFYIPVPRGFENADIAPFISDLNVRQGRTPLLTYKHPPHLSHRSMPSPRLNWLKNGVYGAIKGMIWRRL